MSEDKRRRAGSRPRERSRQCRPCVSLHLDISRGMLSVRENPTEREEKLGCQKTAVWGQLHLLRRVGSRSASRSDDESSSQPISPTSRTRATQRGAQERLIIDTLGRKLQHQGIPHPCLRCYNRHEVYIFGRLHHSTRFAPVTCLLCCLKYRVQDCTTCRVSPCSCSSGPCQVFPLFVRFFYNRSTVLGALYCTTIHSTSNLHFIRAVGFKSLRFKSHFGHDLKYSTYRVVAKSVFCTVPGYSRP